jgi:hypothetical protein
VYEGGNSCGWPGGWCTAGKIPDIQRKAQKWWYGNRKGNEWPDLSAERARRVRPDKSSQLRKPKEMVNNKEIIKEKEKYNKISP